MRPSSILILLLHIICLTPFIALAQLNPERQALNKIKKGEWSSARKILNKALRKDSLSVEATYVYGLLYFSPGYSRFNIDTANHFKNKALRLFSFSEDRVKERLKKFPLDSLVLSRFAAQLDSAAFEQAKKADTENSYIHFLEYYPGSLQTQTAIELRDESAFGTALKQNTHLSFQDFLNKYPSSHRAKEAHQRFEKLFFDYETRDKSVESFSRFVDKHPTSPYTETAIEYIYNATTLDGDEKSFENFIERYTNSSKAKEASQFLLHIKLAKHKPMAINDSLNKIYPIREWIPFYENAKWGFIDECGDKVFDATLNDIDSEYFCEPQATDFIKKNDGIIGRNGATIHPGSFASAIDLGFGFIQAETDSSILLIHKSGKHYNIPELQQIMVVDSQFLACRNSKYWGLFSFTGHPLLPFVYDKISTRGRFIIFSKSGKEILVELRNIVSYAQGNLEPIVADEIRRYGSKYFWIRNGSLEKIIDENLNEVIPFDRQQIVFSPAGLVVTKNKLHYLKDWPEFADTPLESFKVFEPWLITQKPSEKSALYFIPTQQQLIGAADSIWFDNSFAGIKKDDSIRLIQSPTQNFIIPFEEDYTLKISKDSVAYIQTKLRNRTNVYLASSFEKVVTTHWPYIEPIVRNIFLIKESEKYGLMDDKNKLLIKPEFDGILLADNIFALLKNRKFGIYNPANKQLLTPTLDSNPVKYNQKWLILKKDGKVGFADSDNLIQKIKFEFDDVTYWTDSIALVKTGKQTLFYSIHNRKIMSDNLGLIQEIIETPSGRFALLNRNNLIGLMSHSSGIILNPEFDELIFQPINNSILFLGMKKINQAESEIYYMDSNGNLLRKTKTDLDTAYSILCLN